MKNDCHKSRKDCIKEKNIEKFIKEGITEKEIKINRKKATDCIFCRRLWSNLWLEKKVFIKK